MTEHRELVAETVRLAPDLDELARRLAAEPGEFLARGLPSADPGFRSRAIVGPRVGPGAPELAASEPDAVEVAIDRRRERLLDAGIRAVTKVRDDGEHASLTPTEADGLEAIVNLTLQPAILLRGGEFLDPPYPWQHLDRYRAGIVDAARRVGRIELVDNPLLPYGGTGFLVGENLLMTNGHVAELFCTRTDGGWVFIPERGASVDFAEDPDAGGSPRFAVTELVGVHPGYPGAGPDLALFRVAPTAGGTPLPEPLVVASAPPGRLPGGQVYVLGYPAYDPRNDAQAMHLIFADVYNVKRLQPGGVMSYEADRRVFRHDCSTLGGNSGSCVIDLATNLVVGLHFRGKYLQHNEAVALWALRDDELLASAGVGFG
jgi:hypothetical protein